MKGAAARGVATRVLQGGHDVPSKKLRERYPRTEHNLALAIRDLPHALVYDNGDLRRPASPPARVPPGGCVDRLEA